MEVPWRMTQRELRALDFEKRELLAVSELRSGTTRSGAVEMDSERYEEALKELRLQLAQTQAELSSREQDLLVSHQEVAQLGSKLQTMELQAEVEKLRAVEALRKEMDLERMQWRKERDVELARYREWKDAIQSEKEELKQCVEQYQRQLEWRGGRDRVRNLSMDTCEHESSEGEGSYSGRSTPVSQATETPGLRIDLSLGGSGGGHILEGVGDHTSEPPGGGEGPTPRLGVDPHQVGRVSVQTRVGQPSTNQLPVSGDRDGQVHGPSARGAQGSGVAHSDVHSDVHGDVHSASDAHREVHGDVHSASDAHREVHGDVHGDVHSASDAHREVHGDVHGDVHSASDAHREVHGDVHGDVQGDGVVTTNTEVVQSVARLLEAQRVMMAAQVQAMAAQSVPPLRKFGGEEFNTEEGSFDRWIEGFEERAIATGWSDEQRLFQLKAHLEKTAEHAVRMLPAAEKSKYGSIVSALKKRFRSLDIEELCGLEFHQLMQDNQTVEEVGVRLQKLARKAFSGIGPKEFDRLLKGRFYQALMPKWQRKLGAPKPSETFDELYARARTLERHDQQINAKRSDAKPSTHPPWPMKDLTRSLLPMIDLQDQEVRITAPQAEVSACTDRGVTGAECWDISRGIAPSRRLSLLGSQAGLRLLQQRNQRS